MRAIQVLPVQGISSTKPDFEAWRWAFFVPGFMHVIVSMFILFLATDLPDGNYALLKKKGGMSKDKGWRVLTVGMTNYRCRPARSRCCLSHSVKLHSSVSLQTKRWLACCSAACDRVDLGQLVRIISQL